MPEGWRRWLAAVVAVVMIAVLLAATAAGFRFVQSDPLPGRGAPAHPAPGVPVAP